MTTTLQLPLHGANLHVKDTVSLYHPTRLPSYSFSRGGHCIVPRTQTQLGDQSLAIVSPWFWNGLTLFLHCTDWKNLALITEFRGTSLCNHSAAICDRMSLTLKSTGGGSLWAKISGCFPWSRPLMFGSAESEHPRLSVKLFFKEFQLPWSQSTNVTDGQTDRQTDDMRSQHLALH